MADRIVRKVDFPNLLADPRVDWDVTFDMDRRRSSQGRDSFPIGNTAMLRSLGLPVLGPDDGFHLLQLGSGPYSLLRADVAITATRELELRAGRNDIEDIQEYYLLARGLPESSLVYVQRQEREPQGYDAEAFGPWPGSSLLLQMEIASSHKSPAVR